MIDARNGALVLSLPMDPFGDRDLVAKTVSAIGSFDNRAPLDF